MEFERDDVEYETDCPPSGASKAFVESYADKVREVLEFAPGGDLEEAVNQLGGRIRYLDLDRWSELSGSIFIHGKQDFDIVLPLYTSPLRDRFTIGHELGHYFLHSKQGATPLIAMRQGTGRVEWEANWFAAALLMPAEEFTRMCKKHRTDTNSIAAEFGVSRDAAQIRRESLGV